MCWENDRPDALKNLHIVELRREFALGFNVWIVPIVDSFKDELRGVRKSGRWSVPSQSHAGDLVLF